MTRPTPQALAHSVWIEASKLEHKVAVVSQARASVRSSLGNGSMASLSCARARSPKAGLTGDRCDVACGQIVVFSHGSLPRLGTCQGMRHTAF